MKKYVLFLISLFMLSQMQAQVVNGKVLNERNENLVGTNVVAIPILDEKVIGTAADINGEFKLELQGADSIQFSIVGYLDTIIPVGKKNYFNVTLAVNNDIEVCGPFTTVTITETTAPYSYDYIPKLQLRTQSVQAPQAQYNKIPGLFMHAGALNTNRMTIRGIGSRSPFSTTKIKAYLNQIPLTNGIGESNLEDINLAMVDQVQIYKGPTLPSFGAGLGGAIHYRTRRSDRYENSVTTQFDIGSFNTLHSSTTYNYAEGPLLFSLNYDLLKSDGYRDNNNFNRSTISGFAQAETNKDVLTVFVSHTQLEAQIPSGLNLTDWEEDPSRAAANWKGVEGYEDYDRTQVGITHQREIGDRWNTSVTGFLTHFENYERRPFNVLTQNAFTLGTRTFVEYIGKNYYQLKFGLEFFTENEKWSTYETTENSQGDILSDNLENRKYLNLSTEFKKNWDRINLISGVNLNLTSYNFNDLYTADGFDQSGNYVYDPILSPFLSLSYRMPGKINYYATLSHGFSTPTLEETLTPSGLINPEIKPETGWNAEIGIRQVFGDRDGSAFKYQLGFYNMWVENLLVSERVAEDQFIGVNAGKTIHPGIEAQASKSFRIKPLNQGTFVIGINYQYSPHRFVSFFNNELDFSDKLLPGNPSQKLSSNLQLNSGRWSATLDQFWVSKMWADDLNTIEVPAYLLLNARAGYQVISTDKWKATLSIAANNILNEQYVSMVSVNPRSFGSALPRYIYSGLPSNFQISLNLRHIF